MTVAGAAGEGADDPDVNAGAAEGVAGKRGWLMAAA